MTISFITYHYIRKYSPGGFNPYSRSIESFTEQVEYIAERYDIINPADLEKVNYYLNTEDINGVIFSFDDGYKDHIQAANILQEHKANGIFFIPGKIIEGEGMDVNMIHLLIHSGIDSDSLISEIDLTLRENKLKLRMGDGSVEDYSSLEAYKERLYKDNGFDNGDILAIKRILQRDIVGEEQRSYAVNTLYQRFIQSLDTKLMDLYMTSDDIRILAKNGHSIGAHGFKHIWLAEENKDIQFKEVECSLKTLEDLFDGNSIMRSWYSYPYGSFNDTTIELMQYFVLILL